MAKRLNRYLAEAGLGSRRGVESLVRSGRITINGERVLTLGVRVDPEVDVVRLDDRIVRPKTTERLLLYHKPAGVICSFKSQGSSPCLADTLQEPLREGRLFHIGRLDRESTGLLLLGSDGDLAHALLHPSHPIWKRYRVRVDERIDADAMVQIREGSLHLDGKPCLPAKIRPRGVDRTGALYELALREGRNRQIRRIFEQFGRRVLALHRTHFGPVGLGGVAEGAWRELRAPERAELRQAAGLTGE